MSEIAQLCNAILKLKPDVVITEKGISGENLEMFLLDYKI
jgi:hypothetical protein